MKWRMLGSGPPSPKAHQEWEHTCITSFAAEELGLLSDFARQRGASATDAEVAEDLRGVATALDRQWQAASDSARCRTHLQLRRAGQVLLQYISRRLQASRLVLVDWRGDGAVSTSEGGGCGRYPTSPVQIDSALGG